ncbi:MAG TPA: helix-turn-helix domain-containing protein [Casimicrobiaceae bacterium]
MSEAQSEPQAVGFGPGARLRAAREAAGLTLDQAAQQLKLAPRQVKALEEEDFEHLPGRTFTRGFVRNYARLVNLDAQDLLALMPGANDAPALGAPALHSTGATIAELPVAEARGPGLARWLIPALLVACVVGAASYEWYRGGVATQSPTTRAPAPKTAAPVESTAPAVSSTALPNPVAETAAPTQQGVAGAPAATAQNSAAAPAESAAPPAQAAAPVPSATAPAQAAPTEPATARAQAATTPAETPPSASPAPLQLTYRGPSWTQVRDRDGQLLVSRIVPSGSHEEVRGAAPFDIVIGNASAVTLVYRGKPVDLTRYTRQNIARLQLN